MQREEPTEAMILGTLAHMAVLEPERWIKETIVAPACDRRTTAGKQVYAEFLESSEGRIVMSNAQCSQVLAMRAAIHASHAAMELLELEGPVEHSLYWTDPETGIQCKRRCDKIAGRAILDLKFITPKH